MEKKWFILLKGEKKGPFNEKELLEIKEVTVNHLVWCEGMKKWLPIKDILELKKLFKEETSTLEIEEVKANSFTKEGIVVLTQAEPPFLTILLIIIGIVFYLFYQLHLRG